MINGTSITLAMFVKNEEKHIVQCISSVLPIVDEVIVVDTGSTDRTIELAEAVGARVYNIGFTNFGDIRTITAHLATKDWVLMLDPDERILYEDLAKFETILIRVADNDIDSIAFPRKRWADLNMTKQEEPEVYPDWQVRFFRNDPTRKIRYVRRVHETISGCINTINIEDGPVIQHFQNVNKSPKRLLERKEQYMMLRTRDVADGVLDNTPVIAEADKNE